jgi:hypothetical protein
MPKNVRRFPRLRALVVLAILYHAGATAAMAATPSEDTVAAMPEGTCKDLIEKVKQSDCVRPISRFLDGASFTLGLALNTGGLTITSHDSALAEMVGILSPSPYYGFALPMRFFGASRWGWQTSFSYNSSVSVYQRFGGGLNPHDLGTYATMTFVSASPGLFLSLGARDEDPRIWWRFGVGLGAGWASVRGTAYFTEDKGPANAVCHDAAVAFEDGTMDKAAFKSACALQTYKKASFGVSVRAFMEARWNFLYLSVAEQTMKISSGRKEYVPVENTIKLAYIHDL